MSVIRPKSLPVEIGGKTYGLKFTLNAVIELEEDMDAPISEIMRGLGDERTVYPTLLTLITYLVNDDLRGRGSDKRFDPQELGQLIDLHETKHLNKQIIDAYFGNFPEVDDPNASGTRSRKKSTSRASS